MSHEPVRTSYRDIAITLDEETNRWIYTVNGRERKANNLTNARQAIDKTLSEVEKAAKKKFEPIEVYYQDSYWDRIIPIVTLTSIVEDETLIVKEVWVSGKFGRRKVRVERCFSITDDNKKIVEQLGQIALAEKKLNDQCKQLVSKLLPVVLAKEEK